MPYGPHPRSWFAPLCLAILIGCSARRADDPAKSPKLRLTVSQRLGEIPFEVTVNGYLSGGRDDDPRFYCLDVQ